MWGWATPYIQSWEAQYLEVNTQLGGDQKGQAAAETLRGEASPKPQAVLYYTTAMDIRQCRGDERGPPCASRGDS